jgi:putative membrane protein
VATFLAFLHHVAAFGLVAALTAELVLLRGEIAPQARRLAVFDAAVGICAGVLVVVGLLRVFYFEKGAAYYFHNAAFIGKMALFVAMAALSIYPTLKILSWRKGARADERELRLVRRLVHTELVGIFFILLCAAMMARGVGFYG